MRTLLAGDCVIRKLFRNSTCRTLGEALSSPKNLPTKSAIAEGAEIRRTLTASAWGCAAPAFIVYFCIASRTAHLEAYALVVVEKREVTVWITCDTIVG